MTQTLPASELRYDPQEIAGFLAAIFQSPFDELPRLVFADYLDERGESPVVTEWMRTLFDNLDVCNLTEDPKALKFARSRHAIRLKESMSDLEFRRWFINAPSVVCKGESGWMPYSPNEDYPAQASGSAVVWNKELPIFIVDGWEEDVAVTEFIMFGERIDSRGSNSVIVRVKRKEVTLYQNEFNQSGSFRWVATPGYEFMFKPDDYLEVSAVQAGSTKFELRLAFNFSRVICPISPTREPAAPTTQWASGAN